MKKQNGITLIALIITIIVMLILVGVTINVALNGGLFGSADKAASDTQMEAEKEQLLSSVATAYEAETRTISKSKLEADLGTGWRVEGPEGGPYTVTSPRENKYTVNANGAIDYTGKEDESVAGENLGKYVTYQGISWIVLYDDADKVELISADALGEVTLGYNDAGAKTNVAVANENSLTDEEKYKRGAWSYNNVIITLTEACKTATGINENIRNVGGPATDAIDLANVTLEEVKDSGFTPIPSLSTEKLAQLKTNIESAKQEDDNYLADYNQMNKLGILTADNQRTYWLASRFVFVSWSHVYFNTRCIDSDGSLLEEFQCGVDYSNRAFNNYTYHAIRPIVSLSSGVLNGKTEEGTKANPITLD